MSISKPTVAFCILGAAHDRSALGPESMRWRPILDLCAGTRPRIDRLELLVQPELEMLAEIVHRQLRHVAPQTEVQLQMLPFLSPWDLPQVHEALGDFARTYPFRPDEEDYLLHLTTSTAVQQVGLVLLWAERVWPAQLAFAPRNERDEPSGITILSLPAEAGSKEPTQSTPDGISADETPQQEVSAPAMPDTLAVSPSLQDIELFTTRTPLLQEAERKIHAVASRTEAPILLQGPAGCGKTRLARRILALKQLRAGRTEPGLEVACSTLPPDMALELLVGRCTDPENRGKRIPGFLQKADGGPLLLDEVDALPAQAQAALCHVLETGQVKALGDMVGEPCRVSIVATTRCDLSRGPERNGFRADLAARLSVFAFTLPALHERESDVALWLDQWDPGHGTLWRGDPSLSRLPKLAPLARERLVAWLSASETHLKNGFRDLEAAWIRLATYANEGQIAIDDIEREIAALTELHADSDVTENNDADWDGLHLALGAEGVAELDRFDRVQLEDVLRVCAQSASLSEAGRMLFAASRARKRSQNDADRLRKYLARFGLTFHQVQERLRSPEG